MRSFASLRMTLKLILLQGIDQKSHADRQDGHAGCHFSGILLRVALRLIAAVAHVFPRGVEVLLDVDVLHLILEIADHFVTDAELCEELLEAAIRRLTARRAYTADVAGGSFRLARVRLSETASDWCVHDISLHSYFR